MSNSGSSNDSPSTVVVNIPEVPLYMQDWPVVQDAIENRLDVLLQKIRGRITEEAPRGATSMLSLSISSQVLTGGAELMYGSEPMTTLGRVFSSLPYAIVIDQGRLPNRPMSREAIDAIELWVQRKLGKSGKEATNFAWAIGMAIKKRGMPARRFFDAGLARSEPDLEAFTAGLSDMIVQMLIGQ